MYPSTSNPKVLKAFAHPVRIQILDLLETREASSSEIAEELGTTVSSVSYHIQQLRRAGQVRLVKRVERRGALEHFYTGAVRPTLSDDAWEALPAVVKDAVLGSALAKAGAHALAAAREGGFDRADIHFSRTALRLDEEGWAEVAAELALTLERIEDIGVRSLEREGERVPDQLTEATIVLMLFAGPSDRRQASEEDFARGDAGMTGGSTA